MILIKNRVGKRGNLQIRNCKSERKEDFAWKCSNKSQLNIQFLELIQRTYLIYSAYGSV